MRKTVLLTALQALVVIAVPARRRPDVSCSSVVRTHVETVTPPPVTITIEATQSNPAQTSGAEVIRTSNGGIFVEQPASSNRPDISSNTVISTSIVGESKIVITTILASAGGIFFASITTSTVTPDVSITTISTNSGTAQILPTLSTQVPNTQGTVRTSLNATGQLTSPPLISTLISAPTTIISPTATITSVTSSVVPGMPSQNIFQPIATGAPAGSIPSRPDHPVPRLGIQNQTLPISTNKFYNNLQLGDQNAGTWTNPYSVAWAKGGGASGSWGIVVTHIDTDQRVFGPDPNANPVSYFVNPAGIQSIILSAVELGASTSLTTDSLTAFAANVNLSPNPGAAPAITFPLVQGTGFITGIFNGGTPILQSGVFFRSVTKVANPKPGVIKYRVTLEDGKLWLIYAISSDRTGLMFQVVNNGLAQATSNFNGFIQIAKDPGGAESIYDQACGAYPTDITLSGSVNGNQGSYTMSFTKAGRSDTNLLMFALPHHAQSFSSQTSGGLVDIRLATTTKGIARGVIANSWTLVEDLPISMGFAPWSPERGSQSKISAAAQAVIQAIAASEVSQDMDAQTNLDSMYFSGKALAKFAGIIYTLHDLLDDRALAQTGLGRLKRSFATFVENRQQFPLVYETTWGGIVSSASYTTGNPGVDFGNTYYNDHHFHYGYFIYTAAVIAHLDPTFLTSQNVDWVNTLVRDTANPSSSDAFFPVSRNFDWYHGHSWAHGLYASYDGKDQESSSEDTMFAYALKMWGLASGDANIEARGNLQLAITARSLKNYYLYTSDNNVQPANFIGNKVAGILFENKIDHTTYFGTNVEYIQGIHMIPLLPCSTLTRSKQFVQEEWDTYFSKGRANNAEGGWKGILYSNLAIINPQASWQFFSQAGFDNGWIDGGASRTWYLALAAGLGGAP